MGKVKMIDNVPHAMTTNGIFRLANYQSHDNGYSWRMIANWNFKRLDNGNIEFHRMYSHSGKSYRVEAFQRPDKEICFFNPKGVNFPQYVNEVLKNMFDQTTESVGY